ncbi:copper homeostasis protein CutC [Streptococcus loxodontisalivarius]|uniref:PF03932 family protein CutC n=1 Tax=Streptococcus loxodontisalivarius TaxID=1349415 RepID=A0ABS2PVG3_9STRE|nr:copper homeostasis protein CutC [Streptococcus loxodontisalivarius]MBM7643515.1 copper homeostasis protein [Streptococcus loxodontisalivarius]
MIKEFCAENLTQLFQLDSQSIKRVELCDNLAKGGTTPSYGTIKEANRYLHEKGISTTVMIRPRGGSFVYNDIELRVMEEDILRAAELESDALVLGLLTEENELDLDAIEQLLPATQDLPLVFHRAFDQIAQEEQKAALDQLIELGFSRILLHGSADDREILDNMDWLKELNDYAAGRIELVLAGGVTEDKIAKLQEKTGIQSFHGSQLK